MLSLPISLKTKNSYTNTGNYFSKSLIIKENIGSKKTIIVVVEKESDYLSYKKIFSGLHINHIKITSLSDIVRLQNGFGGVYFVEVEDIHRSILTKKLWEDNVFSFGVGEQYKQETCIKTINDIGYEFHEYGKPGSYKKLGDTIHIYEFDGETIYKISFWGDEIESIVRQTNTQTQQIKTIKLGAQISPFSDAKTGTTLSEIISQTASFSILDQIEFHREYHNIQKSIGECCSFDIIGNKSLKIKDLFIESLLISSLENLKALLKNDLKERTVITKNTSLIQSFVDQHNIQGVHIIQAHKHQGKSFVYKKNKIVICDDILSQIFIKSRIKKKLSQDIDLLLKIKIGDYVVHIDHGIGKFVGIEKKLVMGIEKEYIELHYKENSKLFVPTTEVSRLSKYVGIENPKLSNLGTKSWEKKISKIKIDIQKIAEELLSTYAKRKISKGYSFFHNKGEMQAFQNSFPYEYTDCQKEAVNEIIVDMQSKHPMDKLLVGDVGFGKTEVAFHAIYNAYLNKKQSVLISPLVVLAYEHYEKALERFEIFGMRVGVLTRLEKQAEVTKTLKKLAAGELDLVVGTHKLLSDKVVFKDLGLMIVDEEHKFGVQDKEKIKAMKKTIDILAMSATPIPRSLNMALSSIRSISILKTAPFGRKDIHTEISKYDEDLIKQAGMKEFERGGQIFFIHNRVSNIDAYKRKLEDIFPGKKVGVTHGQLPGNELENRILKFKYEQFDILLSTTVIENGIDFPNVNTIFINDCQNFGVSQIHQLRGRVGRSDAQGYCYLLYKQDSLNTDAAKRLKTIGEYSYLGAGFELAMKDLEIRGGGDILGIRQSGQAREIGVSLFIKMLEEKIEQIKKNADSENVDTFDTKIDLQIPAFVPNEFFHSETDKLNFYREIESLNTLSDLALMIDDFEKVNAVFTPEVENLFLMLEIKLKAKKFHILSIKRIGINYQITFKDNTSLEDIKKFLRLDREVLFSVVDIKRLRMSRKHFANDKKFLEYLMKILDNKVITKKIKIKQ